MFQRQMSVLSVCSRRSVTRKALAATLALLTILGPLVVPLAVDAQTRVAPSGLTVPVTGTLNLADAAGTFRIQQFVAFSSPGSTGIGAVGTLVLTTVNGTTTTIPNVTVPVTDIKTRGSAATPSISQVGCDILELTLGPLDLDLLGLEIHLDVVHLEIVAVPGPGNLLGNLLCAIAGLLDGAGFPLLGTLLQQVINLLNQILAALG
jgi:hypothetical protein